MPVKVASPVADRQRRYRQRLHRGRVVVAIEVDWERSVAALSATGFLGADELDNRDALAVALARVVALWIENFRDA